MTVVKLLLAVIISTRMVVIAAQLLIPERETDMSREVNVVSIRLICPESSPISIADYTYVSS